MGGGVAGGWGGGSCSLRHYGTMHTKSICVSIDIELYHTNRLM